MTFESTVPRTNCTVDRDWEKDSSNFSFDRLSLRELRLLASDNGIAAIAMSSSAYNIQKEMLTYADKQLAKKIMDKTLVLHPPQEALVTVEDIEKKFDKLQTLEIMIVGGDFFRKGGAELIDALTEFAPLYRFHLTVVSSLEYGDYASHTTKQDQQMYAEKLENASWVTWYKSLPNSEVLELAKKAHVGCLPTLADTYGFSVLEMQACGMPVITTNVRALPEVNNSEIGWVIDLPLRKSGEALIDTVESSRKCRDILRDGLLQVFQDIFEHSDKLKDKAILSLERIIRDHDPEKYADSLLQIYRGNIKKTGE